MTTEKQNLIDALKRYHDCAFTPGVYEHSIVGQAALMLEDSEEVVLGRWRFLDIDGWWFDECSICGNTSPNHDGSPPDWNYCPNCGAKMMDGDT